LPVGIGFWFGDGCVDGVQYFEDVLDVLDVDRSSGVNGESGFGFGRGRVDVSVAERVRMGREMRNQIHGSMVGISVPVWGSVVVVGLEDTSVSHLKLRRGK
jgi:hypothetical protein